ncbi:hypothetical protein TNCV_25281 [Trichonephila clavipes]|uniref:Uncharacterized protein n=1 Tax=Trichonephila clavipes TaxID=2585209 RepID=A0A8X6W1R6_TRICX|nr:hypothetical protein TNCV_25281 [Trichonephila clavipes]
MRHSSVKTISFHSAAHILLSSHHWWRRRLWFFVKGRSSNGRLADRPLYCKLRRMNKPESPKQKDAPGEERRGEEEAMKEINRSEDNQSSGWSVDSCNSQFRCIQKQNEIVKSV